MKEVTAIDVAGVRRMLAAGMRHVEIARELDLSPWTIAKIARERSRGEASDAEQVFEDDSPPGFEASNLRRCPECGGMVYLWPCLACSLASVGTVFQRADDDETAEDEDLFGIADLLEFEAEGAARAGERAA